MIFANQILTPSYGRIIHPSFRNVKLGDASLQAPGQGVVLSLPRLEGFGMKTEDVQLASWPIGGIIKGVELCPGERDS